MVQWVHTGAYRAPPTHCRPSLLPVWRSGRHGWQCAMRTLRPDRPPLAGDCRASTRLQMMSRSRILCGADRIGLLVGKDVHGMLALPFAFGCALCRFINPIGYCGCCSECGAACVPDAASTRPCSPAWSGVVGRRETDPSRMYRVWPCACMERIHAASAVGNAPCHAMLRLKHVYWCLCRLRQ